MAKIKDGTTKTMTGKLVRIRFECGNEPDTFELWLEDDNGAESLSIMSADEVFILLSDIKTAVKCKLGRI